MGWERYFVEIAGDQVLPRTVRQFDKWAEVEVVSSVPAIRSRLRGLPATIVQGSDQRDKWFGIDMIRKGLDRSGGRRTIVVFGDTYFTNEAVDTIRTGNDMDWAVYGRNTANNFTGTRWGEIFAFETSGLASTHKAYDALRSIIDAYRTGEWSRISAWEWYFEMEGLPYELQSYRNVQTGDHWVNIYDYTDDIDFEIDVRKMKAALGF